MTEKKSKYPRVMRARVTDECLLWYIKQGLDRNMNLSEFIREIPILIPVWEEQLEEKDKIIVALQEEIFKLKEDLELASER